MDMVNAGRRFDQEGLAAFLERPLVAVYAVNMPDGRIHATPVWYLFEDGRFRLIVDRDSPKHRHSMAARRAALCIEGEQDGALQYVTAEERGRKVAARDFGSRWSRSG